MSEFDWIARYFAPLAKSAGAAGLTDDAAGLSGAASIVTVDALVEGVHFLPDDPIETVAQKLVRVNVSDMIAKGAYPDEALLTLGWPAARKEAELARFATAFGRDLETFGAQLIGGDTVTSPGGLFLSLTLTGRPAGPRAPVRRSGAKAGDQLWVTGRIGAGLDGLRDALGSAVTPARDRYRVPDIPPLEMAALIAEFASASMDVSDGLIADAQKLLTASACGAEIRLEAVPLFRPDPAAGLESILAKCTAGDDYQCLFSASPAHGAAICDSGFSICAIGELRASDALTLSWNDDPIVMPRMTGFQHG